MVRPADIHPLTGFLRNHKSHLERLAATGRAELFTINGRAKIVIQDAEAYQKMIDQLDDIKTERIIREQLKAIERGEPGIPADKAFADIRARLKLPKKTA